MIPWLESTDAFPPLEQALEEPNGLLCAGGELSPQRLIQAYRQGIFLSLIHISEPTRPY